MVRRSRNRRWPFPKLPDTVAIIESALLQQVGSESYGSSATDDREASEDTKPEISETAPGDSTKNFRLHRYLVTSLDESGCTDAEQEVPSELSFDDFYRFHIKPVLEEASNFAGRCSNGCNVVIASPSVEIILNRQQKSLCDACFETAQRNAKADVSESAASAPEAT